MTCTGCHEDPHHGEFKEQQAKLRANGTPLGCEACHNVRSWADVNGFDHSKTKFPLLGAHRAVKCGDCHKVPVGKKEIQFKDTSQVCEDCHKDAHDGQFAKAGKTPCADCHDSQRWVPSTFNHDTRTHFPLQGGHEGVACDKCHKQTRMVDAKPVIVYKQAPSKCSDCHGPDIGPLKKSSLLQYANPTASGRTLLTEPLHLSPPLAALSQPMDFAERGTCWKTERRSLAKNPPRLEFGSFVHGKVTRVPEVLVLIGLQIVPGQKLNVGTVVIAPAQRR
jgi:hypothetical protein